MTMAAPSSAFFSLGPLTLFSSLVLLPLVYYAFLAVAYVRKMWNIGKVVDQFPGPKTHWLLGNLQECNSVDEEGIAWLLEQTSKYRRCFRMWIGPLYSNIWVNHPETMRTVMQSTAPKPKGTLGLYNMLKPWVGDGLLLASDQKWFRNRRLLTPGFHFDVLKPYIQIYNEAADIFIDKLVEASRSGSVEISRPVTLLTLNVILRCAFSSDIDVQRQGNPILHFDFIYFLTSDGRQNRRDLDLVHNMSRAVIAKRKKALEDHPDQARKRYPDFLDILLLARDESEKGLTDEEIRHEVDTFLFEGHDTTASAISWILYDIARHPKYQQKCREEIDQFMKDRDSAEIEWADLAQLHFTTQCIKESMRMHSPVPVIAREVNKEFNLNGIALKPGTFVNMGIFMCNHNEDVWGPDHNEFKPERFSPERIEKMDSFAYVPFSAGPRNCIGQNFAMHEIKVVIAKVLYRCTLTADETSKPEHVCEVVMRPINGIKVFIKARQ